MQESVEGVVLKSLLFKENHRIVTLFTKQSGLISFIAKRVKSPEKMALLTPLSQIEVICEKKQSDLYLLQDATLISDHLFLREKWDYLETAGKMGSLLLQSQMAGKPAPLLYALFTACLKQLPLFEEPITLLLLFHLKLLTHEGVLSWEGSADFPLPKSHWIIMKELALSRSFQLAQKKRGLMPLYEDFEKKLRSSTCKTFIE